MGKYVLIESRDPFDSADCKNFRDLASGLAKGGNEVAFFLTQNGVLPARRGCTAEGSLAELGRSVSVLADEFALRERGIDADALVEGVRPASIDALIALIMEDGRKALWH